MKAIEKTVYLVVWVDSTDKVMARLVTPREGYDPKLSGGEVGYKIKVVAHVPDTVEIRDLPVPPITIKAGEISAQVQSVQKG